AEAERPIKGGEPAFFASPAQSARWAKGVAMRAATSGSAARAASGDRPAAGGCARRRARKVDARLLGGLLGLAFLASGCPPLTRVVHNGCKVGPNYRRPPAPLAPAWIDAGNPKVKSAPADYSAWWTVFGDPVLDELVRTAYAQNVNLRVAGTRVLE